MATSKTSPLTINVQLPIWLKYIEGLKESLSLTQATFHGAPPSRAGQYGHLRLGVVELRQIARRLPGYVPLAPHRRVGHRLLGRRLVQAPLALVQVARLRLRSRLPLPHLEALPVPVGAGAIARVLLELAEARGGVPRVLGWRVPRRVRGQGLRGYPAQNAAAGPEAQARVPPAVGLGAALGAAVLEGDGAVAVDADARREWRLGRVAQGLADVAPGVAELEDRGVGGAAGRGWALRASRRAAPVQAGALRAGRGAAAVQVQTLRC